MRLVAILTCISLAAIVRYANHNALRTPPSWGPELEGSYPLRQWARDIMLWSTGQEGR